MNGDETTGAGGREDGRLGAALSRLAGRGAAGPALAVALAAGVLFAPGQTALPPTDRDEARFAQATKQMLETGDLVNIRFQDEARLKKPVGIYWLQAAAVAGAGGAEAPIAAYRLPSLIGAALAAGLLAWAAAPLVGAPAAALAALMLATTALLNVEARIAKTDAALLLTVVVALGALARLALEGAGRWTARLFWAAIGVGVLLKGPIVAIPAVGAAVGVALATRREGGPRRLARALRPFEGLGIVALIAAPWLVLITLETGGAFWTESVGRDLLGKAVSGQESHGAPPGYHTLFAAAGFWPWAALLPLGALWLWRGRATAAGGFLLGWIAAVWLVFELTPTKLPHYVLPAYPALAVATAAALLAGAAIAARGWRIAATAVFALPAAVLAVGTALAVPAIEGRLSWPALAFGLAAGAALVWAGRALFDGRLAAFAPRAAAGAALAYAGAFGFALPGLETGFVSPRLAEATARWRCGAEGPATLGSFREPSAVFLLGTDTLVLPGAEAAAALAEGRTPLVWLEARDRDGFATAAAARGLAVAELETLEGFNYSRGRPVRLTLIARSDHADRCPR